MIPLSDASRRPVRTPVVTQSIIALNVLVFLWELGADDTSILRWAAVPAQLSAGTHLTTVFTSMFMHGGFMHIIGNMLFLWAFAPEVEDAMGRGRFLVFYLLGGIAATVAQVVISPASTTPQLGASGAIAAVMGAFLITYPRDRIKTVFFFGWFVHVGYVPAFVLVGLWLLTQLLNQVGSLVAVDQGGVAYMAHLGGAVFGMLTARLFETETPHGAEVEF
jgi:membrane associated rhomboid family serine protease